MAQIVFILCALTSLACGVLLLRGYGKTRTRLLLWSGLCFVGLAANNAMVFVDLIVFPQVSLLAVRSGISIVSLLVLVAGFVWEGGEER